jgi:N,N-dimethylformamidase beta subunit-like, C-terminal
MLEAYCWPRSVRPGESAALHVSTDHGDVAIEVVRDGVGREVVWTGDGPAGHHAVPEDASSRGCGWPAALTIPVGDDWRSGYYAVSVRAGDQGADAFFVVRPRPDRRAPIVLVLSTTTYDAYNDWGGPSLYTGGTRVSSQRPLVRGFLVKPEPHRRKMQPLPDREGLWFFEWAEPLGLSVWSGGAGWWNWERPFLHWAERNGFDVDVAISSDLDADPDLLTGHRLFLSVGHDEYWSWGMRDRVEAFTAAGGNAAFFGGNTCFWQIRFDDDRGGLTCFKYRVGQDPVLGTPDEHLLTAPWSDARVGRPEPSTTGLTFTRGGYSRYGLGVPRGSGAYTVWRPDHWIFEGTRLRYGDALGLADAIVAYEVDGCELTTGDDGLPAPTHADGAPDTLEVLASAPARLWARDEQPSRYADEPGELEFAAATVFGDAWRSEIHRLEHNNAVMGVFTTPGGGTIFNAGVTDWTYGLADGAVEQITRTVLRKLSAT